VTIEYYLLAKKN